MRSWVVTQVNSVSEKVSAHRLGGMHFLRISGEILGPIFGQFLAKILSQKFVSKNCSLARARTRVCTCVCMCVCVCAA